MTNLTVASKNLSSAMHTQCLEVTECVVTAHIDNLAVQESRAEFSRDNTAEFSYID